MEDRLQAELEALRAENDALKKEVSRQSRVVEELTREEFLSDLIGNNQLSPEEFELFNRIMRKISTEMMPEVPIPSSEGIDISANVDETKEDAE